MPEQESGQAGNSENGTGQTQASEQTGDQQTSQQATFSEAQLKQIEELVRRTAQSDKDRAVSRVEKAVEAQASEIQKIADMVKKGMTAEQIEDRMFLDNLKAQRQTSTGSEKVETTNSTPAGPTKPVDYGQVYGALGLDPNDPEVIRLTAANISNQENLVKELAELRIKRVSGQGVSAGAVTQAGTGSTPNNQKEIDKATEALEAEQRKTMPNMQQLIALEKELAAAKGK